MEIVTSIEKMTQISLKWRKEGQKIAFVPTMGYFHEGHLSLMRLARKKGDRLVVSVFVNPTQFGPQEDFEKYPRDKKRDIELAKKEGVDVLFCPSKEEMYPPEYQTYVEVTELSRPLCGESRPGHFRGVATVVLKLFNIIRPHLAVFGEKDYQQLLVIKKVVQDLNLSVEIVSHPIVREIDGLAMSSRNVYLSSEERKSALSLFKSLKLAQELVKKGERNSDKIRKIVRDFILSHPYTKIDYIELRDPKNLIEKKEISGPTLLAIAIFVGQTRLIDNIILEID
ncbi:pantoate--beta-alanine ligase [Thermosulfuriphilus ammonigenes]|uniref:Pantothenate synthetase n=1 Tax=Thermosulfuriphilus ammonigenes TaxID=1936021 RepID=A0A6G7PZ60_9BACT|nr:pantoate--beta-alanine ligase [Thermosulfuriphilus ammonigenes]QIJ72867.1 pantoate--beta-alanine ligase [Thermosulfuriphilus ammonigenes]